MRKTLFTLLAVSAAGLAVASFTSTTTEREELARCSGGCGCGRKRTVAVAAPAESSTIMASCSGGRCGGKRSGKLRQVASNTQQQEEVLACGCRGSRGKRGRGIA